MPFLTGSPITVQAGEGPTVPGLGRPPVSPTARAPSRQSTPVIAEELTRFYRAWRDTEYESARPRPYYPVQESEESDSEGGESEGSDNSDESEDREEDVEEEEEDEGTTTGAETDSSSASSDEGDQNYHNPLPPIDIGPESYSHAAYFDEQYRLLGQQLEMLERLRRSNAEWGGHLAAESSRRARSSEPHAARDHQLPRWQAQEDEENGSSDEPPSEYAFRASRAPARDPLGNEENARNAFPTRGTDRITGIRPRYIPMVEERQHVAEPIVVRVTASTPTPSPDEETQMELATPEQTRKRSVDDENDGELDSASKRQRTKNSPEIGEGVRIVRLDNPFADRVADIRLSAPLINQPSASRRHRPRRPREVAPGRTSTISTAATSHNNRASAPSGRRAKRNQRRVGRRANVNNAATCDDKEHSARGGTVRGPAPRVTTPSVASSRVRSTFREDCLRRSRARVWGRR